MPRRKKVLQPTKKKCWKCTICKQIFATGTASTQHMVDSHLDIYHGGAAKDYFEWIECPTSSDPSTLGYDNSLPSTSGSSNTNTAGASSDIPMDTDDDELAPPKFTCKYCGREYFDTYVLIRHIKNAHKEEMQYEAYLQEQEARQQASLLQGPRHAASTDHPTTLGYDHSQPSTSYSSSNALDSSELAGPASAPQQAQSSSSHVSTLGFDLSQASTYRNYPASDSLQAGGACSQQDAVALAGTSGSASESASRPGDPHIFTCPWGTCGRRFRFQTNLNQHISAAHYPATAKKKREAKLKAKRQMACDNETEYSPSKKLCHNRKSEASTIQKRFTRSATVAQASPLSISSLPAAAGNVQPSLMEHEFSDPMDYVPFEHNGEFECPQCLAKFSTVEECQRHIYEDHPQNLLH